jgi:ubiquinol-cytochrome c reductase cytochrome b subunit
MSTTDTTSSGMTPEEQAAFDERNMMTAVRRYAEKYWPYERLLPSEEPVYVTRLFYMFGSLALMSFVALIVTGVILVFKGPYWWHTSDWGLFFNSLHFWAVQVFFFTIFVHFGSSFFTAAWRGGRGFTWLFGVLTFLVAVLTGLTGYVAQSNFDGQYIGQQAKDATNSVGLGYVLNLMNLDNLIGWHIVILPLAVAGGLALHLLWVRRHGVVPPFPAHGTDFEGALHPEGPTRLDRSSSPRAGSEPRGAA